MSAYETFTATLRRTVDANRQVGIGDVVFFPIRLETILPLIEAAPDLLAALKKVLSEGVEAEYETGIGMMLDVTDAAKEARALIAKIEGVTS